MKRFRGKEKQGPASRITWVAAWGLTSFLCTACSQGGGGTSPGFAGGNSSATNSTQSQTSLQAQVKELKQQVKNLKEKLNKKEKLLSDCGELTEKGESDCRKISGCKWTGSACELNQSDKCKIEDPATCDGTTGCEYSFKVGCHDAGTCRPKPQSFCIDALPDLCFVAGRKLSDGTYFAAGCNGLKVSSAVNFASGAFKLTPKVGGAQVNVAAVGTAICQPDPGGAARCEKIYKESVCTAHFETNKAAGAANLQGVCEGLTVFDSKLTANAVAANVRAGTSPLQKYAPLCRLVWLHSDAFAVSQDSAGKCSQNTDKTACEADTACGWVPKP